MLLDRKKLIINLNENKSVELGIVNLIIKTKLNNSIKLDLLDVSVNNREKLVSALNGSIN